MADVQWRNRTTGDVFIFGVTAPYVLVQDYTFAAGEPLMESARVRPPSWLRSASIVMRMHAPDQRSR